jgi:hypothetical protein
MTQTERIIQRNHHEKSRLILPVALLTLAGLVAALSGCRTDQRSTVFTPEIPKTWDDAAMAALEVPLAQPEASPKHISSAEYYQLPVRPIYKSYPEYHPDYEPAGYREGLQRAKPQILWDDRGLRPRLETEADWIKAGELVFHTPIAFIPLASDAEAERAFYRQTGDLITKEGVNPFQQLVVREQGQLLIGIGSCADCHTRVMPDGSLIFGAQGNRPLDRVIALVMRQQAASATNREEFLKLTQQAELVVFAAPWLRPDPNARLGAMALDELASAREAIPPGVFAREGSSVFCPPQIPDLIGLKNRGYLDNTGLIRQHSIGDLMRYAALNQGAQLLGRYGDFVPVPATAAKSNLFPETTARYSDEQLYALALYLYSLKPPSNPNLPNTAEQRALVERGRTVFFDSENRCATCHKKEYGYTNNKLTPARDFKVPENHPEGTNIMSRSVGTDPALATQTRRGTGFYKVPSLLGLWYRGPFEHNGSCATLEDWFDQRRLRDDYVPTGWKGPPGTKNRAVKGHEFGLDLSEEERKALIAFLRTL